MDQEQLKSLVEQGRIDEIASTLDRLEIESTDLEPLHNWPHALHLLGHVYNQNLEEARFLWKRMPASVKQNPELQAAWKIVQVFWNRYYESYWSTLRGYDWSSGIEPVVQEVGRKLQRQMLELVEKGYSNISVRKLAKFLGVDDNEALAKAKDRGWELEEDGTLKVKKVAKPQEDSQQYEKLQRLAEYVMHLEN